MIFDYEQLHLGYYVYANQSFLKREDALDLMLLKGDHLGSLQFYYNDHIFSKLDWKKDIAANISSLYKLRAQQLRDKYDYLVLRFSGGSDSTQMLESFLKNGIFIDEIVVAMQEKLINRLDRSMMMNDFELKAFLEYEYAVVPYLNKIRNISPNTKITTIDISDDMYDELVNKKFKYLGKNDDELTLRFVAPSMPKSFVPLMQRYEHKHISKQNTAIVRGLEKPAISINKDDNTIFFNFFDITLSGALDHQISKTDHVLEDFYWSPDFPLIPIKQSHMIMNKINTDQNFYNKYQALKNIVRDTRDDERYKSTPAFVLERMYSEVIYPDWNPKTFAGAKSLKVNADFKLLNALGIDHDAQKFVDEYYKSKMMKYEKIVNKQQLNRFMFSRPYLIGKFEPNFQGPLP